MVAPLNSILDEQEIRIPSIRRDTASVQQPNIEARAPEDLAPISVDSPAILDKVEATATSLLAGEIPQDVIENIERTTAERGIQGGFGLGQASEFMTARSFGLTSLDLAQRGAELGLDIAAQRQAGDLAIAELNNQRAMFNEESNRRFTELQLQTSQWNDKMVGLLSDVRTQEKATNLAVMELASKNSQFINSQITDMAIANSRYSIAGLQGQIDSLAESANLSTEFLYTLFGII